MAKTAAEYKEDLLRRLSGDAFLAEKEAAFLTRDLPNAETDAIAERMEEQVDEATTLGEYLRNLAAQIEEIDIF
jgi:hypothetical protein